MNKLFKRLSLLSEIALSIVNLTKSGIAKTAIVKVITEITPNNALVL